MRYRKVWKRRAKCKRTAKFLKIQKPPLGQKSKLYCYQQKVWQPQALVRNILNTDPACNFYVGQINQN